MQDMQRQHVIGDCRETTLTYHDGSSRRVFYTDIETPYPEGRLIVSRTDTQGIITHANHAFVELSGYEVGDLIGQPQSILRHPEMPAVAFEDLWSTLAAGRKWRGYIKNLRRDGGFYWVFATVVANVREGRVVGYASIRRKPNAAAVREAAAQYAALRGSL